MPDAPAIVVEDNATEHRYEVRMDGALAGFAVYRLSPAVITFVHTEIDPSFEGHGLGSKLVRGALDSAKERGLAVRPECPFVRSYIEKHDEYLGLVAPADRAAFGLPAAS